MKKNIKTIFNEKTYIVILVLLFLTGIFFRIYGIDFDSPTGEELLARQYAQLPFSQIAAKVAYAFPPLFYYLNRVFYLINNSNSLINIRLISLIFGCLSLIVFFYISKLLIDKKKSLLTLLLFVLAPYYIYESQNNQYYSFIIFFTMTGMFSVLKIIKLSENNILQFNARIIKYYLVYLFSAIIILYTHYTGIIYTALTAFILLIHSLLIFKKNNKFFYYTFYAVLLLILFFAPWYFYAKQYDTGVLFKGLVSRRPPTILHIFSAVKSNLIGDYIYGLRIISGIGLLISGYFIINYFRYLFFNIKKIELFVLPFFSFSPLIALFCYSQLNPMFDKRYISPFFWGIYLILIIGYIHSKFKYKNILMFVYVLILFFNQYNRAVKKEQLRADWRSAAEFIKERDNGNYVIVPATGEWRGGLNYWLNYDESLYIPMFDKQYEIAEDFFGKIDKNIFFVYTDMDIDPRNLLKKMNITKIQGFQPVETLNIKCAGAFKIAVIDLHKIR